MCELVDADYEKIDFKKDSWFTESQWSMNDQNSFSDWLIDYMKVNSEARKELMNIPSTRAKFIKDFSNMFIFNYGWKVKL